MINKARAMKKEVSYRTKRNSWGIVFVLLFAAVILGAAAAVLPSGFMARIATILVVIVTIFFAWAFRNERNLVPENLLFIGLMLLVLLSVLWPRYIYFHYAGLPSVNLFTLSTMVGLYVVSTLLIFSPKFSSHVNKLIVASGWIGKSAVVWLAWRFLACILGTEPIYSIFGFMRELIYVTSFLLFGYVIASLDGGTKWLIRMILFSGVLVGLAGIIEAFTEHNFFSKFATAGEYGDLSGSLANIALEKIRAGAYRAQSTFDHPIVFAQFVAAITPLAIYGLLRESSKFWRLVALVALPVALLAIAKSGSRAGIVSVVIAFLFMGIVLWLRAIAHGKMTKAVAIIALPALLGAIGIGYLVLEELAVGRGRHEMSSSEVRLLMLKYGIAALGDSPIWGFGQGLAITKAGIANSAGLATIDNYLLSIALDSGYVGLGLLFLFLAIFTFKSLAFAVAEPGTEGLFVGACMAGVLAIVATFAGLSIMNNMTLLWLLVSATFPFFAKAGTRPSMPVPL